MPHVDSLAEGFHQLPPWTLLKVDLLRQGLQIRDNGASCDD
jgi:hypothetical protein